MGHILQHTWPLSMGLPSSPTFKPKYRHTGLFVPSFGTKRQESRDELLLEVAAEPGVPVSVPEGECHPLVLLELSSEDEAELPASICGK